MGNSCSIMFNVLQTGNEKRKIKIIIWIDYFSVSTLIQLIRIFTK